MELKLEVVGREVIKPASPAPHDELELSHVDVTSPAKYVSTIYFYKDLAGESSEVISKRLKSSLSKTLSHFYPLAGQIEGVSINCNDKGAVFSETRTNLLLSDFLENQLKDIHCLEEFLPPLGSEESAGVWPLLGVNLNFFGSNSGLAIAVIVSHKLCDASSMLAFVQGWAATAKGEGAACTCHFAGATVYPPPPKSFQPFYFDDIFKPRGKGLCNRFLFTSSKIDELKRKAASESVGIPTRVEAIMSLIWRCAKNATRSSSAAPKSTLMVQPMDLRSRIPSNVLSGDSIGNLTSTFMLVKGAEDEMDIGEIVAEFRKTKEGLYEIIKENLTLTTTTLGQNLMSYMESYYAEYKEEVDIYSMSSWCRMPFYKVDFGWGTPVWMGTAAHTFCSTLAYALLLDSKNDQDIEVWVGLPEQDMQVFVLDQDLLAYALLNPPVLI